MQALIGSVSSASKLHVHIRRHCLSVAIPDYWVSPSFCSPLQQCSQSLRERGWKLISLYLPHLSTLSPKLLQITYCFLTFLYVFHPAWQSNTRISWQSKKGPVQGQLQVLNSYHSPSFPHLFHILQRLIKDEIKLLIVLPILLSINVICLQQNKF